MMNGTAWAGGPFGKRKATSHRFGLREIEEDNVAGRHRQRSTQLQLDRMAITASVARVSPQILFHRKGFLCPLSHSLLPSATNVQRISVHFQVG